MCFNPMWRVPVSPAARQMIFGNDKKGYRNGAFVISQKDPGRLQHILGMLELTSPVNFRKASEGCLTIPCGVCLECKINNSKDWAQRAVAESLLYPDSESWFVTLTYDDDHLPAPVPTFSRHNLQFGHWSPLVYEDFELFKKRLLEYYRDKFGHVGIRFFVCGEYGPTNGRPHFHCIFYNLPLPDLNKSFTRSIGGKDITYLESKLLSEKWQNGFVTVGQVCYDTAAYIARYVLKKFSSVDEMLYEKQCKDFGWQPLPKEFRQASRRPGLGRGYYDLHKSDIYKFDKVYLPEGQAYKPSTYYDRLYDIEEPELLEANKLQRRANAQLRQANELKLSGIWNPEELQAKKKESFIKRISKLKRPL